MSLSAEEHEQMVGVGTEFISLAEPVDYNREKVPYPAGFEFAPEKPDHVRILVEKGREYAPLEAGLGRYIMLGACGNLETIDGWERCGIYADRPQVCQQFEAGADTCLLLRERAGLAPIPRIT